MSEKATTLSKARRVKLFNASMKQVQGRHQRLPPLMVNKHRTFTRDHTDVPTDTPSRGCPQDGASGECTAPSCGRNQQPAEKLGWQRAAAKRDATPQERRRGRPCSGRREMKQQELCLHPGCVL